MSTDPEKPKFIKQKHLKYLDNLRETGVLNMFGARPYLMDEFPNIDRNQAREILTYWMQTYSFRHPAKPEGGPR